MHPRPTLYEYAGGDPALEALAQAHHARCLAEPELNHPFSHADLNPEHVARLAAYWAEVLGGPARWSEQFGTQSGLLNMHAHNGDMTDLGRRFVDCFVAAMDDAGLPDDAPFRAAMRFYMRWAVDDVPTYGPVDAVLPDGLPVPRWSWNGPAAFTRPAARPGRGR